jgi:integrase
MPRRPEGHVRPRGNRFLASVPRLANPKRRAEYSFATEWQGWQWINEQLTRREEGFEPEPPRRTAGAAVAAPDVASTTPSAPASSLPTFASLAADWHREYYDELEQAGPDRAAEAWRNMEQHVIPAFSGLLGTDVDEGRAQIKDWLRTLSGRRPLTAGSTFSPCPRPYARQTVSGHLWLLRQVLAYARHRGYDLPPYADDNGMTAMHPLGRPKKRRAPVVSVIDAGAIAGQLHVIHQLVLWLLRLCGLRISESYGLMVADFFVDEDGTGFITAGPLGGKSFRVRTDTGEVEVTQHKEVGKTESAYRLIVLPDPLTTLILKIIEAFHTSSDGSIDPTARLVPDIRNSGVGQSAFRSALKLAAAAVDGPTDDESYRVIPHDMRKGFATDLAWADEVSGLAARRAMGHRIGTDVFDLVYTLDSRLKEHLVPVARQIEREIVEAGLTTLMVPTVKRPVYGTSLEPERVMYADMVLLDADWQITNRGDLLDSAEAAALLGREVKATRRLFPRIIPATKVDGEWRCTRADVLAYAERTNGLQVFNDVVERSGLDYYVVYRALKRLGLVTTSDPSTRVLLLTDADAEHLLAELARVQRLRERSVTVLRAAAMLGTTTRVAYYWADTGRLNYDEERDLSGTRYVTIVSVKKARTTRQAGRRPAIAVIEFMEITGFGDADIRALVRATMLSRVRPASLTVDSVLAWVTGHRPELLSHPLLLKGIRA